MPLVSGLHSLYCETLVQIPVLLCLPSCPPLPQQRHKNYCPKKAIIAAAEAEDAM